MSFPDQHALELRSPTEPKLSFEPASVRPMKCFLDLETGETVLFRLSREQWEALPFVDEAAAPRHLQVFRDRARFGVVHRWLGGPESGSWWMATVTIDDGRPPPPPRRRLRAFGAVRAALAARRER